MHDTVAHRSAGGRKSVWEYNGPRGPVVDDAMDADGWCRWCSCTRPLRMEPDDAARTRLRRPTPRLCEKAPAPPAPCPAVDPRGSRRPGPPRLGPNGRPWRWAAPGASAGAGAAADTWSSPTNTLWLSSPPLVALSMTSNGMSSSEDSRLPKGKCPPPPPVATDTRGRCSGERGGRKRAHAGSGKAHTPAHAR